MTYHITIQHQVPKTKTPAKELLKNWAMQTLKQLQKSAEMTIRIVSPEEITELNATYRHKNKPTNVLSFPFDMPEEVTEELPYLGDIVICADVVNNEAEIQHKEHNAHWAHMIIHGTLHLLGYDHETDTDASLMEPKEIMILQSLGFPNPYQ